MKCKSILTVLDFSENTGRILDFTIDLAIKEKASVCLMHPEPPRTGYIYMTPAGPGYSAYLGYGSYLLNNKDIQNVEIERDTQALEILKDKVEQKGIDASISLINGDAVTLIISEAERVKADMIIIGGHQQGFFADLVLGNPEKALIKKSPCPVLIIPEMRV